jgi:hypothetical protein
MNTDAEAGLIERRWSATVRAVRRMQAECEVLREVTELAEASWRHARGQLSSLEALRDVLGEQLAERDALAEQFAQRDARRGPEAAQSSVA